MNGYDPSETRPLSVVEWMLTLLVLAIPIVNIVMYLMWAFSGSGNVDRRNFCRASILWFLILLGLSVFIFVIFAALGLAPAAIRNP